MSQHSREEAADEDETAVNRHLWLSEGSAPPLCRPDEETADESGWTTLTYEEASDDEFDDTPLSDLSEAEVDRRLDALER